MKNISFYYLVVLILSACDNDFSLTGDNKKNRMIPTIKRER